MDSGNGGQQQDWNYWRRVANEKGANIGMDGKVHNQSTTTKTGLTDEEKRQRTATSLARKKLLATYKMSPEAYAEMTKEQRVEADAAALSAETQPNATSPNISPSSLGSTPAITPEEWKKYHTAWQNYYQNYYGQYYGRAANDYVARERVRLQKEQAAENFSSWMTKVRPAQQNSGRAGYDPAIDVQDEYRERIREKASKRAKKMRKSKHWIPLTVGLSIILVGVLLQYNQVIVGNVMAYMSPGNSSANEISGIDPTVTVAVHENPTLMIPKLNVEVPIKFGSGTSVQEMNVSMSNGVAHFSVMGASAVPGQIGNFAVAGHSAGNVYSSSRYKFIFSGLTRMEVEDLMYVDYEGVRYTYRVTGTKVVEPTDVKALGDIAEANKGKPMLTLITCTPLGTSRYRLLVYGEQIYPSYEDAMPSMPSAPTEPSEDTGGGETSGSTTSADITNLMMPENAKTPLESFWNWLVSIFKWLTGQR